MSRNKQNSQKLISLTIATVAAGIPVATLSAAQLNFTSLSFIALWILPGVIGSFVTYLYFNLKMRDVIGTFTLGYMLAVILRFVADILINNVAHADLSLALLIALLCGAFSGWFGSAVWVLIRRQGRKQQSKN